MRFGFRDDVSARTPFSAVAILLLMLSTAFTSVLTDRVARDSANDGQDGPDFYDAFARVRERFLFEIRSVGEEVVEKGIIERMNDTNIREELEVAVTERLSADISGAPDVALEGLGLSYSDLDIGLRWQDAEIVDIVTSEEDGSEGPGTVDHKVAARLVGSANVTITDNATGDTALFPLRFDEPVAVGTSLAGELLEHIAMANEGLTDVGQIVRFMLEKLAMARLFSGETDGDRLITPSDVEKCLSFATRLELAQTFRTWGPADVALSRSMEAGDDLFDLMLEEFGISELSASAIMTQYWMGLLDYWVLWIFDYLDIGENSADFWGAVGSKFSTSLGDVDLHDIIRDTWRDHFDVNEALTRYISDVLRTLFRTVLTSLDLERIDVREMDGEGWSSSMAAWFDRAVNSSGATDVGVPRLSLDAGLASAIGSIDNWMELPDWLQGIVDEISGLLGAASFISGLVDDVVDFVFRGISEFKNTLVGMAVQTVRTALAGIESMEDMLNLRGDMMFMTGTPFTDGSVASEMGEKSIETVSPAGTALDYRAFVRTEGIHNTAPKDRLAKVKDAFHGKNIEDLFVNVFPYQAIYNVTITGTLTVKDVDIGLVDTVTMLRSHQMMTLTRTIAVNITFELPVSTGTPLENIDYSPTNTLVGDVMNFLDQLWKAIRDFPNAIVKVGQGIVKKLTELGQTAMENLMKQNALWFYKVMNQLGKAIYEGSWSRALETAFDICDKIIGKELKQVMTIRYKFDGLEIYGTLGICSRTIELGFRSEHLSFKLELKQHAHEFMQGKKFSFIIAGSISWGAFSSDTTFDPFVLTQDAMFETNIAVANLGGRDLLIHLSYPELKEQLRKWEFSLQECAGGMLRIPLPPGIFVKVDAGIRVRYMNFESVKVLTTSVIKVVTDAFKSTLGQFSLGEIMGETFDMDTLEGFLVQLLQNLIDAFREFLDKTVPEIELFIKADVEEASGSGSAGFGVSFVIKQPVSWLFSIGAWIIENVRNFIVNLCKFRVPGGMTPAPAHMWDYLFIRIEVYMRVGTPAFMKKMASGSGATNIPTELVMAFRLEVSLATVLAMFGRPMPRYHVTFGLIIPDVPQALMAWWPKAKVGKMDPSDFWFVRGDIWWVGKEDLLITEVMYEPDGTDADLEYVEIYNPTARRVDLNGWQLRDNVGTWTINTDRDIAPGKHLAIVRKGDPFRETYGVAWDFEGMTLNLNNDGDRLQLLDPRGKEIDKVAWEGVDGWSVVAEKGEALIRDELVEDSGTQAEWYYGPASPGEANA